MNEEVLRLARVIWDFHQLRQEPEPADIIISLGTNDLRVAEYAAELYHAGFAPRIVFTGGFAHQNDLLATHWDRTEAEMFAAAARRRGVPEQAILLETRATNTTENIRFSRELLEAQRLTPQKALFAVKAFMQRRVAAALGVEWPEVEAVITSPRSTLEEYFTPELPPEKVINIMLGDLQRLWVYPKRGWAAPQEIPERVKEAFEQLVAMGFDKHLLRDE